MYMLFERLIIVYCSHLTDTNNTKFKDISSKIHHGQVLDSQAIVEEAGKEELPYTPNGSINPNYGHLGNESAMPVPGGCCLPASNWGIYGFLFGVKRDYAKEVDKDNRNWIKKSDKKI